MEYYEENFKKPENETQIKGIYFVNEPDKELSKQYMSFIQISYQNRIIGYVVLDMKMEGENSQGFYPDLLKNINSEKCGFNWTEFSNKLKEDIRLITKRIGYE